MIRLLMIVRGACRERAEVSLRTPRESVLTRAPGRPAASALMPSAVRTAPSGSPNVVSLSLAVGAGGRGRLGARAPGAAGGVLGRPGRRHVPFVGVLGEHALDQPHRRDAVDERVVHLAVHRDPAVAQSLDQVDLPQRPLEREPRAVQPAAQLEQLAHPARLRQGAVPDVVLEVEVLVLGPAPLARGGDRPVRPLEEQWRRVLMGEHLVVHVLEEASARALRLAEQLQTPHVHRLAAVLGEQEAGRGRVHRSEHLLPLGRVKPPV